MQLVNDQLDVNAQPLEDPTLRTGSCTGQSPTSDLDYICDPAVEALEFVLDEFDVDFVE